MPEIRPDTATPCPHPLPRDCEACAAGMAAALSGIRRSLGDAAEALAGAADHTAFLEERTRPISSPPPRQG